MHDIKFQSIAVLRNTYRERSSNIRPHNCKTNKMNQQTKKTINCRCFFRSGKDVKCFLLPSFPESISAALGLNWNLLLVLGALHRRIARRRGHHRRVGLLGRRIGCRFSHKSLSSLYKVLNFNKQKISKY